MADLDARAFDGTPDWGRDIDWTEYHPSARELLPEEFFWDPADEESPHGTDSGAGLLGEYLDAEVSDARDFLNGALLAAGLGDASSSAAALADPVTRADAREAGHAVLAVAFAQLKVSGAIDDDLRRQALAVANARRAESSTPGLELVRAALHRHPDVAEAVLVGGVEHRELVLAEYDPAWPAVFEEHRGVIDSTVAEVVRIEHIGSTSVPGLAAKPIIDVLVVVPDLTEEEAWLSPLLSAGYELRVREPGHRMVRTPARDVHVHVLEADDPEIAEYLLLRDRLRADPADRRLYEDTKRALLTQFTDMNRYADAKSEVVAAIKERARSSRS